MTDWRLRQENLARPFPYVYPQMPPRLRRCCAFTRTLLLLEWGCLILMAHIDHLHLQILCVLPVQHPVIAVIGLTVL